MSYKPGVLINVLSITREQFRYWRRELDPVPSRPLFSFQLLLAYAVIKELVTACWLEPRALKKVDMHKFFCWFETKHDSSEISNTVIEIDKKSSTINFKSIGLVYQVPNSQSRIETIFLKDVETSLIKRIRDID